jgi:small subunit ribosomal protein S18
MEKKSKGARGPKTRTPNDNGRKIKKKTSVLISEKVDYVDYKDANLLQRFVSDRSKIRARRVSGNDVQQQRDIAMAIKNSREMAIMPYAKRVSTQRTGRPDRGERGPRRDRNENTESVDTGVETTVEVDETTEIEAEA